MTSLDLGGGVGGGTGVHDMTVVAEGDVTYCQGLWHDSLVWWNPTGDIRAVSSTLGVEKRLLLWCQWRLVPRLLQPAEIRTHGWKHWLMPGCSRLYESVDFNPQYYKNQLAINGVNKNQCHTHTEQKKKNLIIFVSECAPVCVCVNHVFKEWPLALLSTCKRAAMFVGVGVY